MVLKDYRKANLIKKSSNRQVGNVFGQPFIIMLLQIKLQQIPPKAIKSQPNMMHVHQNHFTTSVYGYGYGEWSAVNDTIDQ